MEGREKPGVLRIGPAPSTDGDAPVVVSTEEEAARLYGSGFARAIFQKTPAPPYLIIADIDWRPSSRAQSIGRTRRARPARLFGRLIEVARAVWRRVDRDSR